MTLLSVSSRSSVDRAPVMAWIPVRDLDFFFVPRSCHVGQFAFHNDFQIANFMSLLIVLRADHDEFVHCC